MSVEVSELRQIARQLTGSEVIGDWHSEALHEAIASATTGIWRVQGEGWSSVLKLIGHREEGHPNWRSGEEVGHWYYWRREAFAYESGLVSSFVGGMRAPQCYLARERPDRTVALWLEDLASDQPATNWPVDRYELAARHLGRAQGEFVAQRPLPDAPWLSRGWLRSYLSQRDTNLALLRDRRAWATPLARRFLDESLADPLLALRADQPLFLQALERAASTVCHLDLHPANMFATDGETVLIDWSFVGIGSLGEDPGNLVPDAVFDFHVPPEQLDRLDEAVYTGYLAGLRDGGWSGSDNSVRLAMDAAIAAKYAWIAPAMLRAALDHEPKLNRRPIEETFTFWAPTLSFLLRCADRVRTLIQSTR